MTAARTIRAIPEDLRRTQVEASDPAVSAWVTANAGSGKTHVLAQRVIRLLLRGIEPAKILCLTFTKAAAANMANQVFATLAQWVALDDEKLDGALAEIEESGPPSPMRARARRLFAQALETPGGLKVQTIHAFCARLLHQFPFEADVAARFAVLEERAERELLERLRLDVLLEAAGAPDSALGRALATAITMAADRTFGEVIDEAIRMRETLEAWIARAGSIAAAVRSRASAARRFSTSGWSRACSASKRRASPPCFAPKAPVTIRWRGSPAEVRNTDRYAWVRAAPDRLTAARSRAA